MAEGGTIQARIEIRGRDKMQRKGARIPGTDNKSPSTKFPDHLLCARPCAGSRGGRARNVPWQQPGTKVDVPGGVYKSHPKQEPQTEENQSGTEGNPIGTAIIPPLVSLHPSS